jgi:TonB family protein
MRLLFIGMLLLLGQRDVLAQEELSSEGSMQGNAVATLETQDQMKTKSSPQDYSKYDVAPEVVKQVQPDYPDEAMKKHLEGTVWLQLWVGEEGKVLEAKVQKSDAEVFNQAAIDAGRQWLFKPASANGKPISVWITVPFRFKLMDGKKTEEAIKKQEKNPPSDDVQFETAPEAIHRVFPKYPEDAKKEKLEGTVWLKVWIDESGRVTNATVQKSDTKVFESAAVAAVKQWKFKPAIAKGKPVSVWVSIPFRFKLEEKGASAPVPGMPKAKLEPPVEDLKVDKEPEALKQINPKYPQKALKDRIEGTVTTKLWIDDLGNVVTAKVAKTDNDIFNEAAINAGKQWKFKPALLNGKPVAVWITVPFRFKIAEK